MGYAARGLVYLSMGALALLAALDLRESAQGSRGSLAALAQGPLGWLWLSFIAAGLLCFTLWRGLQAFLDADRQGRGWKAMGNRAGQAMSGLIYGALAVSVLELLDELEDLHEADEEQETQRNAAMLMSLPYGELAMMSVGVFVMAAGAFNIAHGLERRFHSDLECSKALQAVARPTGRVGYIARGVAFAFTGFLFAKAGLDARSSEARGLGGALQALEVQPGGSGILILTAVGLVAFGLFGLIEARYRRLRAPKQLAQ